VSVNRYIVDIGGEKREVSVEQAGEHWAISVDGETRIVERIVVERDELFSLIVGDHSYLVDLVSKNWRDGRFVVSAIGEQVELRVRDELEAVAEQVTGAGASDDEFELKAPMPGIVLRAMAEVGDSVERGQGLVVLEAMKMQNELASELEGVVQEILVEPGQMIEAGATLARVIREEP
jgi:biotin carboxyl carrier protein